MSKLIAALFLLLSAVPWTGTAAPQSTRAEERASEEPRSLKDLIKGLLEAESDAERDGVVAEAGKLEEPGRTAFVLQLKSLYARVESRYRKSFETRAHELYFRRLASLSFEEIKEIQKARYSWAVYFLKEQCKDTSPLLAESAVQPDYKQTVEPGVQRLLKLLLLDPVEVAGEGELVGQRRTLARLASSLERLDPPDPNAEVKISPSGVKYPPRHTRPTAKDRLSHLERALVLATTAGGDEENRRALLENLVLSEDLDVEEINGVLYANQRRLFLGICAFRIAPIVTIACRDHSVDLKLKQNNAQGHFSDKGGFVERAKRFGPKYSPRSEGVGGGRSGPAAVQGLSYGGGHTAGLHAPHNTEVGFGFYQGSCTVMYCRGKRWSQVVEEGYYMPPGIGLSGLPGRSRGLYQAVRLGAYGRIKGIGKARAKGEGDASPEAIFNRFIAAHVEAMAERSLSVLSALRDRGDLYRCSLFAKTSEARFGWLDSFKERIAPVKEHLKSEAARKEIETGKQYTRIFAKTRDWFLKNEKKAKGEAKGFVREQLARQFDAFSERKEASSYGEAARLMAVRLRNATMKPEDVFIDVFASKGE